MIDIPLYCSLIVTAFITPGFAVSLYFNKKPKKSDITTCASKLGLNRQIKLDGVMYSNQNPNRTIY